MEIIRNTRWFSFSESHSSVKKVRNRPVAPTLTLTSRAKYSQQSNTILEPTSVPYPTLVEHATVRHALTPYRISVCTYLKASLGLV